MSQIDNDKIYIQYAQDILSGKIKAGWFIIKACQRMLDWFDRDDIWFDYDDVDLKIRFMQKLKHTKAPHTGQQFILAPYQSWMVANIIGWKWIEDEQKSTNRVINTALMMLSRKAGKTFFASALMLAIIVTDKQVGAEGYMISNTARQAGIAFEHATQQCRSIDPEGLIFTRYRGSIRIPALQSYVQILSSDTNTLDGLSPSVFIVDEYHASKTDELYNILRNGQGVRKNPLGCIITTAGFLIGEQYPLYAAWMNAKDVLSGAKKEDTLFAAIYQLDEHDDWLDESNWIKSNPTLGHTVDYKYLREQVTSALNNSMAEVSTKTKNFNCWCQSSETWFSYEVLKSKVQHVDLHDYEGEDCFMGVDFSMQNDLCAFVVLIPPNPDRKLNPDKFIFKPFIYIPDQALEQSANKVMYQQWIRSGIAKRTPGNVIDTLQVLDDQLAIGEYLNIVDIAYDQYFALDWQIHAEEEGLHITKHLQSLAAFTPSTDFFENIMAQNLVILDDNVIFIWMFGNVEMARNERTNNKKPMKANNNKNNKIDAVIASLEALTAYNASRGHAYGRVWAITE